MTKHTVVSAMIPFATVAFFIAGVGFASVVDASAAHARTVCRVIHNHQVCREVADLPMPPKPDPKGTKMK